MAKVPKDLLINCEFDFLVMQQFWAQSECGKREITLSRNDVIDELSNNTDLWKEISKKLPVSSFEEEITLSLQRLKRHNALKIETNDKEGKHIKFRAFEMDDNFSDSRKETVMFLIESLCENYGPAPDGSLEMHHEIIGDEFDIFTEHDYALLVDAMKDLKLPYHKNPITLSEDESYIENIENVVRMYEETGKRETSPEE